LNTDGSEKREKTLADMVRSAPMAIAIGYPDGRMEKCNTAFAELTGYTLEELQMIDWNKTLTPSKWNDIEAEKINEVLSGKDSVLFEKEYIRKDGSVVPIELLATAAYDSEGNFTHLTAFAHDITERKRAEDEHSNHLHFLENLQQMHRVIQTSTDIEQMMSDVLQVSLEIFESDRAGLFYPCDPDADSWSVPMERTRPEYPSELPIGEDIPMTPEVVKVLRNALEKDDVITIIHQNEETVYETAERFSFLSEIYMPIHTHAGQSWLFVMHQCSYYREWTDEEQNLFREIGRRIGDALSSLLFLRDLSESERSYRTLTENMPGIVYRALCKGNGRMVFFNDIVTTMTGYKPEELSKGEICPIEPYIHPEDHDYVLEVVKQAIDDKAAFEVGYRFIHKNDSIRHFYERGKPIFDSKGSLLSLDGIIFDITERKQAEEALRESKERLRLLSDNLPVGYVYQVLTGVNNQTRRFTYVSGGVEKLHEISAADVLGDASHLYGQVFEEDACLIVKRENEAIENMSAFKSEVRFKLPSGKTIWVLLNSSPRRLPNHEIVFDGIAIDITERKQAEEALLHEKRLSEEYINSLPGLFYVFDKERFVKWNRQWEQVTGS